MKFSQEIFLLKMTSILYRIIPYVQTFKIADVRTLGVNEKLVPMNVDYGILYADIRSREEQLSVRLFL
jgi:hypothetical protein